MKITPLLILGLLFSIFVNFSFAASACQMPKIAEYNNCLSGCNDISDLIQKSNCSNTCIGNWSKSQGAYNKCLADELEQVRQKKLEEQKLLEQRQAAEAKKATVSNIKGEVKVLQPDGTWKEVSPGSKIQEGDQIRTGSGSAIINFSDGSSIEIGPNSSFKYSAEFYLKLLFGKIRIWVQSWGKKFEVRTPSAVTSVRGTEFIVEHSAETNITKVYLFEGLVDVTNLKNETMQLQPGDTVTVDIDGKMVLGKLDQEKWNQLTNEISLVETPEQTVQPSATKQETTVQPPTKTLLWFGLIVILLCIIGAGIFIYRKKS